MNSLSVNVRRALNLACVATLCLVSMTLCLVPIMFGPSSAAAQSAKNPAPAARESGDFFIIWSVDSAKNELLLKLPTEVTEVVRVNTKTRYLDGADKPIKLDDLRAGDTIYVLFSGSGQNRVAQRIRKGPMTVEELRRRYLK